MRLLCRGVGNYTYGSTDGCGTAGPYAVKAVAGTKVASYCYDLNGNMTSGDGRTITWSAFGMPTEITKGLRSIALTYGPDRGRFKRVDTNETGITSTYYVAGGSYEVAVTQSGQTTSTAYIGGVATVATTTNGANSSTVERYLLKQHLGSFFVCASDSPSSSRPEAPCGRVSGRESHGANEMPGPSRATPPARVLRLFRKLPNSPAPGSAPTAPRDTNNPTQILTAALHKGILTPTQL